ncbi:MAG TPA: ABC transporter substrate-binding protein [Candidatus Binatia bacterium]
MTERSIRIGGLGPLTLPGLWWAGHELKDGMTLAVEHINGSGGVLGRPLTLLFEDTQGRPEVGLAAVEKLLGERVHVFAGEFHSVVADNIVESIQRSSIPFLCASATMDSVTARRLSVVFRLAPPQSYGWSVYADCLASHGFQHVVALQEDNPYWNGGSRVIEARLHSLGVRFTRLPLTAGSTDVAVCIRQVQGMRSEHSAPDILLMHVAYPEPFVSLAREASERGLVPPACFLGDPAGRVACQDQWGVVGTDATSVPFLSYMRSEHPTEEGQRLAKEFKGRFGREPTFVAYEGYDSVLVVARACADAGTVDPGAVCNSLRSISVRGSRGTIQFSTEPDGVVHQQWKWPPVCVVAYARPQQTFAEADLLWDTEHGDSGRARLRREAG